MHVQTQILVPLDGSPQAETILPQALALAQATGSALLLTQVVPALVTAGTTHWMVVPYLSEGEYQQEEKAAARRYLTPLAQRLDAPDRPVHAVVLDGDPAATIVAYATAHSQVSLIAMTTHGRTGLGRWILGSVAEAVLHAASVPLLLARLPAHETALATAHETTPPLPATYRTILVPLDGSVFAEQALDQAYAVAAATGAKLVLVVVVANPPTWSLVDGAIPARMIQAQQEETARLTAYLTRTTQRLAALGLPVDSRLCQGYPAETILRTSEEIDADLIIMATHGRTGFQQVRLGSVALKVVQGAIRPIYLLRANATAIRQPGLVAHPTPVDLSTARH